MSETIDWVSYHVEYVMCYWHESKVSLAMLVHALAQWFPTRDTCTTGDTSAVAREYVEWFKGSSLNLKNMKIFQLFKKKKTWIYWVSSHTACCNWEDTRTCQQVCSEAELEAKSYGYMVEIGKRFDKWLKHPPSVTSSGRSRNANLVKPTKTLTVQLYQKILRKKSHIYIIKC